MSSITDREKWLSVGVTGMASRIPDLRDKQLTKDRLAYQRLRKQGLQPPRVDGCAVLEQQAVTKDEIEMGTVRLNVPPIERKKKAKERRDAIDRARELMS